MPRDHGKWSSIRRLNLVSQACGIGRLSERAESRTLSLAAKYRFQYIEEDDG